MERSPMLWLFVGLWLLSPALLLIFWLLDVLAASIGGLNSGAAALRLLAAAAAGEADA